MRVTPACSLLPFQAFVRRALFWDVNPRRERNIFFYAAAPNKSSDPFLPVRGATSLVRATTGTAGGGPVWDYFCQGLGVARASDPLFPSVLGSLAVFSFPSRNGQSHGKGCSISPRALHMRNSISHSKKEIEGIRVRKTRPSFCCPCHPQEVCAREITSLSGRSSHEEFNHPGTFWPKHCLRQIHC